MQYDETQRGEQIEPNQSQKATKPSKKYGAVKGQNPRPTLFFLERPSF
jgi:hypothetical protein